MKGNEAIELLMQLREFIAGIVVAVIGFFAVRYLRKDKIAESLTRKTLLLDLREKMRSQGVDNEQLIAIESEFERQDRIREVQDRLTIESFDYGVAEIEEATCQQGMNAAQGRRLTMLNAKLGAVVNELSIYLDDDDKAKLKAANKAWESYREQEAKWASRVWGGGSMAPFIHAGEASRLTVERLAALQTELEHERAAYARGNDHP